MSANALPDAPYYRPEPAATGEHSNHSMANETVVFVTPRYDRYVWPYELCRSYESAKALIEEAYAPDHLNSQLQALKEGSFDLVTEDDMIILPSVWSSIIKPFATIKISFRGNDIPYEPPRVSRTYSPERERRGPAVTYFEDVDAQGGADDSEEDLDSTTTTEVEDEPERIIERPEKFREVIAPTDAEGNKLSYGIDTSRVDQSSDDPELTGSKDGSSNTAGVSKKPLEGSVETLRITKSISVTTDNKTVIQVSVLPGPETLQLRDGVKVTWYHLQANQLDFDRFRQACVNIPNLSDRLQTMTRDILAKVEKHKVKAYLDGLYVEPGTVMRADERCQPNPQSVTFSCIPYFDLQQPIKGSTSSTDRVYPPRTLMQCAYPYEPVRERDSEQAYKKFGTGRSTKLVYVPDLWMMNIGANIVVTSGHRPLVAEMTKSIEVVEDDLKSLGATDLSKDILTRIRLTNWDGRVLLYPLVDCRTFFQLEQKIRELDNSERSRATSKKTFVLDNDRLVTPRSWPTIVRRTDRIFIELATSVDEKAAKLQQTSEADLKVFGTVPPFFHWPVATQSEGDKSKSSPSDHTKSCLELVEKALESVVVDQYEVTNAVDGSFATTKFYAELPEDKYEHINTQFSSLPANARREAHHSFHASVIDGQCADIVDKANEFCKLVQATLTLFVRDVDAATVLRKIWGAMGNIHTFVTGLQGYAARESSETSRTPSHARHSAWYVRDQKNRNVSQPEADKSFAHSLRRCRRCRSSRPFDSSEAAIAHLRSHLTSIKPVEPDGKIYPDGEQNLITEDDMEPDLQSWIVNESQLKCEVSLAGALTILKQACDGALELSGEFVQLADGVRKEDGDMSELYTFPRSLVEALHRLIVFYLAIERALHHTELPYQTADVRSSEQPYSDEGLAVLRRFVKGTQGSIAMARDELCSMVKSDVNTDTMHGLSLGPEYVCGWLMRRLLVKPLEKHMAIGDMYREYLSTIQFQVNHRPGKRLIRSINLLQEELQILVQVNSWQKNLIQGYLDVLNDATYEKDIPSRRAMFQHEKILLESCLEQLALSREDYTDLIDRCGPLSDSTKQSLEINEEDHGKAIMVFTIVTIIFLPLSFVTSFFGMNTVDIRDMSSGQSLFWAVAIPLTAVTMGSAMLIGYNGDDLRDAITSMYLSATGKHDSTTSTRGISVAQRKRAHQIQSNETGTSDISLADEAEYAIPRLGYWLDRYDVTPYRGAPQNYLSMEAPQPRMHMKSRSTRRVHRPEIPYIPKPDIPYIPRPDITYIPLSPRYSPSPPPPVRPYVDVIEPEGDDEWYGNRRRTEARPYEASLRRYNGVKDGGVQEYTWHAKSRRRQRRSSRERVERGYGGYPRGYGVREAER